MASLRITHISDPGCPFAYSAMPFLTALRWRYGDQLEWRHAMIGLTEDRKQYEDRGYTPTIMARHQRRFRPYGMPFIHVPKPRMAATALACRLVVATRLTRPDLEWPVFRSLQFTQFTTTIPLDDEAALRDALTHVPELDARADELIAMVHSDAVTEAYEADRAEARTAAGSPTEFQGKSANTDGAERFTAPSLIFETEDGRALEGGGFQPLEAYDVLIANLDTSLVRRGAPEDVAEVLQAFPYGLTTREIAWCMVEGTDLPDDDATRDALLEVVARGDAVGAALGDGDLWRPGAARFSRAAGEPSATVAGA